MGKMATYPEHSDSALMVWIQEGDERAFTEIYRRYRGVLFVHAFRMLENEEEAKDIVQELFTVLWVRRKEISVSVSVSSYLYGAVRNRVLDCMARKKTEDKYIRTMVRFMEEGECITDQQLREKELSALIEREVSMLPDRMREVFELSRQENLSYKEIAEELNISDKTVKKQVSNALSILRKRLDVTLTLLFGIC